MKQRILSIALAVCLCLSVIPAAYAEGNIPTPQDVYETLIALKDQERYREGTQWDDTTHSYTWKGGAVAGNITEGTGCAAFAFELSDKAFNDLTARTLTTGNFQISDVRAGDILRINNNSHSVIVLQATDGGAVIAEANYHVNGGPGVVHWGRSLSKAEVEAANYLITRYPEGYLPPDDPTAGEAVDSGTWGSVGWKLTKAGTLTISGSGAMPDFAGAADAPWYNHMDKILTITIENGVTNVGSNAFYGSAALSASIPGSVRAIGDHAFSHCINLVSVHISEGVETIGQEAFRACTGLPSIVLPASVRSVGDSAFLECSEMGEATFQRSAANEPVAMGSYMFARCWKLSTVALPQAVDRIADGMFLDCLLLTSLDIPQGAASIGESAFASCPLISVYIPASVEEIGRTAFPLPCTLNDVYFGGDEAAWNSIQKDPTVPPALSGATMHYNAQPAPSPSPGHTHSWAPAWSGDDTCHWHECAAENCDVTANSGKDGYGAHSYGSWVADISATAYQSGSMYRNCTICGYRQTEIIPASGSPSFDWNDIPDSSAPSAPSGTTATTRNPDGSTTTTKTDNRTGTVTEITNHPDGSQAVVETKADGTVTTLETSPAGAKTETTVRPDGSRTVIVEREDGASATVSINTVGEVKAEVSLPAAVAGAAQQTGKPVVLPVPEVRAGGSTETAPAVTVNTGSGSPVKVEIPVAAPTSGTVAVIVHADGAEEVVKTSVLTAEGLVVSLPDGATVKIVDNSKDFMDVSSQHWAADAIDFVTARELFTGTSESAFTPEAPVTRAMLMVVLARLDGADTSVGATWYEKGVEWAVANGISDGSSPERRITREQLVVMLWRYAGSPAAAGTLAGFADADQIGGYAQEAMRWAVESGIVSGFGDGQLEPQGQAARAQVAQMLKNFVEM